MTALTTPLPTLATRPVVTQLARAEARRLLRHPLVLVGLALGVAEAVATLFSAHGDAGFMQFLFLSGAGHWPLAVGAFVAADLLALRSWRHGTAELEDATVTPAATRTAALLGATAAALAAGVALLVFDVVLLQAWNGLELHLESGFVRRAMHPIELLQGPVMVTLMAVSGVAVGRWVPTRVVGPLALLPAVIGFFHSTWRFDGTAWRFSPLMAHEEHLTWVATSPSSGYSILGRFEVGALGWHLLYLVGLGIVLAAVAIGRDRRSAGVTRALAVGAAIAVVGGLLQLP